MTFINKRSLIALLLSLVMIVSLFTVCASAIDTTDATQGTEAGDTAVEDTADTTAKGDTDTETDTNAATGETTEKETESATEAPLYTKEQIEDTKNSLIINSIIIGTIVLLAVILIIKFRTKLKDFMRSVKSELKKIVWSGKENTKKSFLVVLVVAVSVAIILALIDLAFSTGLGMLNNLIK